jgi:cyclase
MNAFRQRIILVAVVGGGLVPTLWAQDRSKVEIRTIPVAENLYVLAGAGGNIALLTGDDGTLLIDDGYKELTEKTSAAVEAVSKTPIRLVVNTHWHSDHVGGNGEMAGMGAVVIAHESVRGRMSEDRHLAVVDRDVPASPPAALPKITFPDASTLYWNGEEVNLLHVPPAHTDGDSLVYFRKANVLHAGDTYFNGMYPFIDVNAGGSLDGMVKAADLALTLVNDQTKIIPGHGPLSDAAELKRYRNMLATVRDRVRALIKEGKSREEVIAAKPTGEFDGKWGGSWLPPDKWVGLVYDGMSKD